MASGDLKGLERGREEVRGELSPELWCLSWPLLLLGHHFVIAESPPRHIAETRNAGVTTDFGAPNSRAKRRHSRSRDSSDQPGQRWAMYFCDSLSSVNLWVPLLMRA